jgi:cysteine desulfurase
MMPFLEGSFGNPSSLHNEGRKARKAIDTARAQVASLLGASPTEITFTASGTEADNLALVGATRAKQQPGHIISSVIEHPAVLETCRFLERSGTAVTYLPVDHYGLVDPANLRSSLRPDTHLVSIMAASNIVGTIQPIQELARIAHEGGVLFHTDAVQAAGKIPLDVRGLPVDLISLSAHKLHGPKGVGALYIREGTTLSPLVFGGGQENGLRSATENVAGIVGFGAAAELARGEMAAEAARLSKLRHRIIEGLRQAVPQRYLIGHPEERLPGHLSLGFAGQEEMTGKLVLALDRAGVAVSAGSACSAHHASAQSSVLLAMGFRADQSRGLLRVALGRFNTASEVERFLTILPEVIASLGPISETNRVHEIEAASV